MKINHRAHLWGTLQKKLVESKSKAVIQKQWENIIETPVLAVTSRDRQVLAGGYGTMCLPSGSLCFCHKMLCPRACLQEQAVEDPKKLQLHTQTRFAFQQPRLPTPAKSQDKALLKMWAFYRQNITLQKGSSSCSALEEPQLSYCVQLGKTQQSQSQQVQRKTKPA